MKTSIIDDTLSCIGINSKIITKLNNNGIYYIKDIWVLKRKDLKNLNLSIKEINEIIIKLQLNGLDLNKKTY